MVCNTESLLQNIFSVTGNGGLASSAVCECGAEQTVDHVVLHCTIHRPPPDYTTEWLPNTCPDIYTV